MLHLDWTRIKQSTHRRDFSIMGCRTYGQGGLHQKFSAQGNTPMGGLIWQMKLKRKHPLGTGRESTREEAEVSASCCHSDSASVGLAAAACLVITLSGASQGLPKAGEDSEPVSSLSEEFDKRARVARGTGSFWGGHIISQVALGTCMCLLQWIAKESVLGTWREACKTIQKVS